MRDVAVGHQRVIHLQHRDGALRRQLCRPFFFDAERGTAAGDRIPEKIVGVEPFPHQSQKERPGRGTTGVGDDSPDNIRRGTVSTPDTAGGCGEFRRMEGGHGHGGYLCLLMLKMLRIVSPRNTTRTVWVGVIQ